MEEHRAREEGTGEREGKWAWGRDIEVVKDALVNCITDI